MSDQLSGQSGAVLGRRWHCVLAGVDADVIYHEHVPGLCWTDPVADPCCQHCAHGSDFVHQPHSHCAHCFPTAHDLAMRAEYDALMEGRRG